MDVSRLPERLRRPLWDEATGSWARRRDGRLIWPIAGGSQMHPEGGQQQQQQAPQQGQQQGQQGQGQQGTGQTGDQGQGQQQTWNLLGGQAPQQGQQQQGQQGQGQQQGQSQVSWEQAQQFASSEADRRVNQYRNGLIAQGILNPDGSPRDQQQPPVQQQQGTGTSGQPPQQQWQAPPQQQWQQLPANQQPYPAASGPTGWQPPAYGQPGATDGPDAREARITYRDFVSGVLQERGTEFLGTAEREIASRLATAAIAEQLAQGQTPENAGRNAARLVGEQVLSMRTSYETATIEALKRRGAIDTAKLGQPVQSPTGNQSTSYQADVERGQSKAKERYAHRRPQQQQQTQGQTGSGNQ